MLLTLEEIKAQLRLDADLADEDDFLKLIGEAVQARTETYLNRKLYNDEPPDTDPDGLKIPADIKMAMLLLATHFYENRASVTEIEMSELPQGYAWLAGPYRFIPL